MSIRGTMRPPQDWNQHLYQRRLSQHAMVKLTLTFYNSG